MSATADTDGDSNNETRKQRARNRYIRLVYTSNDPIQKVTQRRKDGEWQDAHMLRTSDGDADECSCPDCQMNGNTCYHMEAWNEWEFDAIVFSDGQEVEL